MAKNVQLGKVWLTVFLVWLKVKSQDWSCAICSLVEVKSTPVAHMPSG